MLYDAGADLVLNGHDHLYARYAPIKPSFVSADTSVTGVTGTWLGTPDPKKGIREFIVGTGGETLDAVVSAPTSTTDWDGIFNQQNLEAYTGDYWGVMALTLDPNGYEWDYESALAGPTGLVAVNGPTFLHRMRMVVIATRASASATVATLAVASSVALLATLAATEVITITKSSSSG